MENGNTTAVKKKQQAIDLRRKLLVAAAPGFIPVDIREIPGMRNAEAANDRYADKPRENIYFAGNGNYYAFVGGGDEWLLNNAAAIAARKKDDDALLMWMMREAAKETGFDNSGYAVLPWSRRLRKGLDDGTRKKKPGGEDEDAARRRALEEEPRKRVAADEEGRRIIIDEQGRVATDAEGRAIVLDGENGHRLADAGNGTKVVVTPEGRVLNGPEGKPVVIDDGMEMRIEADRDGARYAVGPDGSQIGMSLEEPEVRTSLGTDIDTLRTGNEAARAAVSPSVAPAAAGSADIAENFRSSGGAATQEFRIFLTQHGESLETLQQSVRAAMAAPDAPRIAAPDVPARGLDVPHIRGQRVLRMLTPNGFDLLVAGGVGTGVALYEGMQAGAVEKLRGGDNTESLAAAAYAGRYAGLGAAADTLPVIGSAKAYAQGRTAEGTVRAIEDTIEIASPLAFGAVGAAGGAAATSWSGPGALLGGSVGFVGGVLTGVVVSLTASEATRAIARGLGYDDVDRGMIGAWLAPQYAEEMESWVRSLDRSGKGWANDESLSDVMERINEGAADDHERTARFRGFLDHINNGIYGSQTDRVQEIAARIGRDTGIENVTDALRLPEMRARIAAFYGEKQAAGKGDAETAKIMETMAFYEKTEAERGKVIAARIGADMMDARAFGKAVDDRVLFGLEERMRGAILDQSWTSAQAGLTPRESRMAIDADLASIGYNERLENIRRQIAAANGMSAREVVTGSMLNGTDAYGMMGTREVLAQTYHLMMDAKDAIVRGQEKAVSDNWERLRNVMTVDARIDGGLFHRDTTLGARLAARLSEAKPGDADARELSALLAESGNLSALDPRLAVKLLDNRIFRQEFATVDGYRRDRDLKAALSMTGFTFRFRAASGIEAQLRELDTVAKTYGFDVTVANDPAALAPRPDWTRRPVREQDRAPAVAMP